MVVTSTGPCSKWPSGHMYAFFDDFNKYEDMVKKAEEITTLREINYEKDILDDNEILFLDEICFSEKTDVSCNSLLNDNISSKIQNPHIICEKFKYLYDWLIGVKKQSQFQPDENDYIFLNYWLNDKLRANSLNSSFYVKDFYAALQKMDKTYFTNQSLQEKLNNIESHDLENMNILFDLYKAKSEIYSKITDHVITNKVESCLPYKRECNIKYREGIINCRVGCNDFHHALKQFKCLYEKDLAPYKDDKDDLQYKKLFELPDQDSVIKEYRRGQFRRITTTSFLVPVFGFLLLLISSNKFSPFRHYLLEKLKSTKNVLFSVEERENKLLSYASDSDSNIMDEEDYNIGYYSVRNF
ncbi:PIR Superfamily Protein [Plasmodium ovale wallikeri]|uniref:PIR Superfamily Protein n=2 Tax=Plasmodium ovale TaxID=36330 RepID=A0A1A8YGK6_PLAOA|nr:PIR Superfamily Protein [Plasmodium ovale wallikeri]SBT58250.1 PIR Superfamily Protein [Plasmodium ovale wallikeri]SBT74516.1 PIR protein [Plasmodium ovale]